MDQIFMSCNGALEVDVSDTVVSTVRAISFPVPYFLLSLSVSIHRINIYVKYLILCLIKKSWF